MARKRTSWLSVVFSLPGWTLPALLSFVSLGGAGAARLAVTRLFWPLVALSVAFLAYSHHRVWVRKEGRGVGSTFLIAYTAFVPGLALYASVAVAPSRFPVSGKLAGQDVQTSVDSELAAYDLEHYMAGGRSNANYDTRLDKELVTLSAEPSDREALRRLSERFSTDLATIYFVARLFESPLNRRAQLAFHMYLERLKTSDAAITQQVPEAFNSYLVAFVPGYAYKKDRTTGADFARQRQIMSRHGFHTALIETDELGGVEDNATMVAEEIIRLGGQYNQIILVSASKGGPEVALALGERLPAEAIAHVRAWISVGGLLRGSPYADQALHWPKRWLAKTALAFQGLRPSVIENLSTEVRRPAFARLRLPANILTLQYVGVPLSGHIGKSTRERYEALRTLGPNDGLTLLADELVPGGLVVTDVGLDHYYRDPEIDLKTFALAFVVLSELEQKGKTQGSGSDGALPARSGRGPQPPRRGTPSIRQRTPERLSHVSGCAGG